MIAIINLAGDIVGSNAGLIIAISYATTANEYTSIEEAGGCESSASGLA
jgi:hypothetical protein